MEKIDLNKIYKRKKSDRDIFQELMPFKVKEILLIANYYDSYTIEREGQFSGKIFGEYLQLNLFAAPRFTSVANEEGALHELKKRHFDLIIIMAGLDKETPILTSRHIKELYPDICQLMLVNNNADLSYLLSSEKEISESIERVFVWNGSTKVFLAMAKYLEDKINLEADTKLGDVRVILVVEDSVKYYSRYLPLLYTEIMSQTQAIIAEEPSNDEMGVILRMRVRPKLILVSNFDDAVGIINKYRNNIIGVISDVRYAHSGVKQGSRVSLIKYVQQRFIFRNHNGKIIDRAHNIEEFRQKLMTIPDESLEYHAIRNGISTWLMARAEINLAKKLRRYSFSYFKSPDEIRRFIANVFEASKLKKLRGRIIKFNPKLVNSNRYITLLGDGSLGGKGRGLAFLSNFIENVYLKKLIPDLRVAIPKTAVIGVDEFDNFLETNNLYDVIFEDKEYDHVLEAFRTARLSEKLRDNLRKYLQVMTKPLAVRSSGLFEDSLNQPFAGVYSTYLLPNNHPDFERRLEDVENAIKLVFASIYSPESRAYFNAIDYMIEEEKMAVIIQEVIGNEHNGRYYPEISGVAQSYNFYPFSYIQPEDGFAVTAIGLGAYVVGGEKTHRFSPAYPKLQLASTQDKIKASQRYFYGVNMLAQDYDLYRDGENAAIKAYDISEAERDGTLEYTASVYDFMNDQITYDFSVKGPRIVDFSKILQYDYFPLAPTLQILLNIFSQAMGSPVEIEFSVNFESGTPIFYLLQIKPLIKNEYNIDIDDLSIDPTHVLLKADKGMGNGKLQYIRDVVYVDPDKFDRLRTEEIAEEIKRHNSQIAREGDKYLLIGPGRWGTRDPLTGIPVQWSDIANAKVIVEQGLPDFPLDASLGSHFFHNITSMQVGYFAIPFQSADAFINFDILRQQDAIEEFKYSRHVRFKAPLTVWMDGKKQTSVVTY
ncbi:MAG: PEP/pyruvate-binding domain-containing protein [Butyricimonas virosa]